MSSTYLINSLTCTLLMIGAIKAAAQPGNYYNSRERQNAEYKNLNNATNRAYSVPNNTSTTPAYNPGSSSSTPSSAPSRTTNSSGSSGDNVTPWKPLNKFSGRPSAADVEAARKAEEPARKAKEAAERAEAVRFEQLKQKWAAEDKAWEPVRSPIRQQYRDAGFTAEEAQAFGIYLAKNPETGYRQVRTDKEAAVLIRARDAKLAYEQNAEKGSYEALQQNVGAFILAGETGFLAQEELRRRFPEKAEAMRPYELASIGTVLGTRYIPNLYLTNQYRDTAVAARARARFWEIYKEAPAEAAASCGHYSSETGCPIIYKLRQLEEERSKLPIKGDGPFGGPVRKEFYDTYMRPLHDLLLRIEFDAHPDGSQKTQIEGIQRAGYLIASDKERFLGYSNEDWIAMGRARNKGAQDMVRYIIWCRDNKDAKRWGEKVISRLEKAGIR